MTPLDLAEALLASTRSLACQRCGGRWLIPRGGPAVLFHACTPQRGPRIEDPPTLAEDRQAWAAELLGADMAAHLDETTARKVADAQRTS